LIEIIFPRLLAPREKSMRGDTPFDYRWLIINPNFAFAHHSRAAFRGTYVPLCRSGWETSNLDRLAQEEQFAEQYKKIKKLLQFAVYSL